MLYVAGIIQKHLSEVSLGMRLIQFRAKNLVGCLYARGRVDWEAESGSVEDAH